MRIYALKDEQAMAWLPGTFMAPNNETALRSVAELSLQQPDIPPFKYPDVFRIYCIGEFDEQNGFRFAEPIFVSTVLAVINDNIVRQKKYREYFKVLIEKASKTPTENN